LHQLFAAHYIFKRLNSKIKAVGSRSERWGCMHGGGRGARRGFQARTRNPMHAIPRFWKAKAHLLRYEAILNRISRSITSVLV
jgi:hypothetical protein